MKNSQDYAKIAVIVAGGSGARMQTALPKQFLEINGKTILQRTLTTFLSAYPDLQIILVIAHEFSQKAAKIIALFSESEQQRIKITRGGTTRFESVQNGLRLISMPSIIFVHDAVRCLISTSLIQKCFETAFQHGSAVPAIAAVDSIRIAQQGENKAINRADVRIIQTPQTFKSEILLPAFEQGYKDFFTDEASVVESFGEKIYLVEGEISNIKITHPIDLIIAEFYLNKL